MICRNCGVSNPPGMSCPCGQREAFAVKDSGQRTEFASGMVRDRADHKVNYHLAFDGPMFKRWAEHVTKGAIKYGKRNWMKAEGYQELERAFESLCRHFYQYLAGELDEDHAAAIFFNINEIEYIREKLSKCLD